MLLFSLLLSVQSAWVVKDVLPPVPQSAGAEVYHVLTGVCGDLDDDGCVDGFAVAMDLPAIQSYLRLHWSIGAQRSQLLSIGPDRYDFGGAMVPGICLLNSPLGLLVVGGEKAVQYHLTSRLLSDPAVPIAVAPNSMPRGITRADDMNGDGWEDIFYQDLHSDTRFAGLMDGRTLTKIWEKSYPKDEGACMVLRTEPGPLADLNGDTIPDFIAVWPIYNPLLSNLWEYSIQGFSGADGSLLWENREAKGRGVFMYPVSGRDLTGDAVVDLLVHNAYLLKLVSGLDGATVWSYDPQSILQSVAPAGYVFLETCNPAVLSPTPDGSGLQFIVPVWYYKPGPPSSTYRFDLGHFDPYTGAFLGLAQLPENLQPWFTDAFQNPTGQDFGSFALGDIDRDGLQELAIDVPAPAYDLIANGGTVNHIVTLGMRTLEVPAEARLGSTVHAQVQIPSSPHHGYYLIGSRRFSRLGSLVLDGWETNLLGDPWLQWSRTTHQLSGTLDALGQGSLTFNLPVDPSLAGQSLYLRAIILDLVQPNRIKTISTLGITRLLP